MTQENIYRGLSFTRYKDNKVLKLKDIELVKQDLLAHIFTVLRERLMMPSFGTSIHDMIFEQLTDDLLITIEEELTTIIEYDPRVDFLYDVNGIPSSVYLDVNYDEGSVTASVDIEYVELDFSETLHINLEFKD